MNLAPKHLIIAFLVLLIVPISNAQQVLFQREKIIVADSAVFQFDSLTVYPNSFSIDKRTPAQYYINPITATLYIVDSSLIGVPLHCKYLVFDTDFSKVFQNKSPQIISSKGNLYQPEIVNMKNSLFESAYDGSQLESDGSIIRGFSVGNNQDFVLNSSLNLQLTGFLAPDIEIKANITDKNVPVQPEGNTRRVQDFDKIFITLNYKNKWFMNAGDIEVTRPNAHFMVLNKKIIGMELSYTTDSTNRYLWKTKTGGGVSKGRFVKQKLNIINGKQGPYKLTGNIPMAHIVILAGSERVYIDNKLMLRGLDQDYVIDYNTGEITFTAKILVTIEKEINVEYEYSDLSYSRYTLYSFNQMQSVKNPKWNIRLNFYQEKDLRNSALQPELNDSMKLFLSRLYDDAKPLFPGVDTSSFYPGEILYQSKDSLVDGVVYHIYYYSTDQTATLYRLNMSWIGENQGDYILVSSGANGRVFQWVAPLNNIKQGNYDPVIQLTTPILRQMGTLGFTYDLTKSLFIDTEFSLSNYDQNLFSTHDEENNLGFAHKLYVSYHKTFFKNDSTRTPWTWIANAGYEFQNRNFNPIEPYRAVEFYKDYNLTNTFVAPNHETMIKLSTALTNPRYGETKYDLNYYTIQHYLSSWRNQLTTHTKIGSYLFTSNTSILLSDDTINNSQYLRTMNQLSKTWKKIELGIYERFERNLFLNKSSEQLMNNSFQYNEFHVYIKNNDSISHNYKLLLKNIITDQVKGSLLSRNQIAYEAQALFDIKPMENQNIKGTATIRRSYQKDTIQHIYYEDFFIGSLEYVGRFFKNAIQLNTYYEAGSGMEQKKVYSFIKVATGQGTHIWNDYNQNQIEELNEFEVAVFQNEANYIKIWIVSNDYIYTYNNTFTQTIHLKPALLWSQKSGFLKWVTHFQNATLIRISQKNTKEKLTQALNPFIIHSDDTTIIHSNILINNTITYNHSRFWGADYYYKLNQNKNYLYYGPENKQHESHEVLIRVKPTSKMIFRVSFLKGNKWNSSTFFQSNNYSIRLYNIKVETNFQIITPLNLNITYQYKNKNNIIGREKLNGNEWELDLNYRIPQKGSLSAKTKYTFFKTNQNIDGSLGYEMLEGLGVGKNLTWTFVYQMQISEYLMVDFQYNGRINEKSRTIHSGALQMKVIF